MIFLFELSYDNCKQFAMFLTSGILEIDNHMYGHAISRPEILFAKFYIL